MKAVSIYKLIGIIVLGMVVLGCAKREAPAPVFALTDVTGAPWGRTVKLDDHNGKQTTLSTFQNKIVILFFGYTNCPDMCPMTMHKLSLVMQRLGPQASRVQVLMATLDPVRDTPEILKQYVPAFHPSFLGLHGSESDIAAVALEFKLFYKKQTVDANGFYTVDHMGPAYIFDTTGALRLFASDRHTPEMIAKDVQTLLLERG